MKVTYTTKLDEETRVMNNVFKFNYITGHGDQADIIEIYNKEECRIIRIHEIYKLQIE